MATMIPSDIENFNTEGERRFYEFLQSVAKPDQKYTCWYNPDIERREPDFILFCDELGLLIFEVKDWALNQIKEANPRTFTLRMGKEKFAGAEYTTSIEYMMPDTKMIQGPDAHFDGQNFAKAFDIKFLDKNEKTQYAWQNTFGFTTRMLGVMIAVHGDDKGLVLPPYIAPTQIVVVPIFNVSPS